MHFLQNLKDILNGIHVWLVRLWAMATSGDNLVFTVLIGVILAGILLAFLIIGISGGHTEAEKEEARREKFAKKQKELEKQEKKLEKAKKDLEKEKSRMK